MDSVALTVITVIMLWTNVFPTGLTFIFLFGLAIVVRNMSPYSPPTQSYLERLSHVTGRAAEYFSAISIVKAYAGEKQSSQVWQCQP